MLFSNITCTQDILDLDNGNILKQWPHYLIKTRSVIEPYEHCMQFDGEICFYLGILTLLPVCVDTQTT